MTEPEAVPTGLRFGTDGVRARAGNRLDEPSVRALGLAAAPLLGADRVVIGRDTRASGPGLLLALAEGRQLECIFLRQGSRGRGSSIKT